MIKAPNLNTFYRFLRTFQLLRKIFVTLFISYVFFLNFAREIGARPAKIDPLRMPDVVMDIKEELRHWERVPAARPFLAQNLMVTELLIIRGSNTGKSNKDSHG